MFETRGSYEVNKTSDLLMLLSLDLFNNNFFQNYFQECLIT